jgi:hypothetical protein
MYKTTVVKNLSNMDNTIVRAKAGTGKSTYNYHVADELFHKTGKHSLILTFSRLLKTRGRDQVLEKDYITVHSFHSSVCHLFGVICYKSDHFSKFLQSSPKPIVDLKSIGLLIIDEVQDLNEDLDKYISILRSYLPKDHKMLLTGDTFQNVFSSLQNSSTKWIDDPEKYFGMKFQEVDLSESYRVPPNVSNFINQYINPNAIKLHYPNSWNDSISRAWGNGIRSHISTHIHQDPVDFHRFRFYKDKLPSSVIDIVKDYIRKFGSSSILVVVRSCKFGPNHPVGQLINMCPEAKWIVLTPDIGEDGDTLHNKAIVGTTFKLKGYEAKCVLFCGLDSSLERDDPLLAFALAYVGCSRPNRKLIILSDSKYDLFFTMRTAVTEIKQNVQIRINIADLVTYNTFDPVWDILDTEIIQQETEIELPTQIYINKLCEPLGSIYEVSIRKALLHELGQNAHPDWVVLVRNTIKEITELSHVKRQLPNVESWIDSEALENVLNGCLELLDDSIEFEPNRFIEIKNQTTCLYGIVYLFLDDSTLINVHFSKEFNYTQGQELLLLKEALLLTPECRGMDLKTIIINPIAGESRLIKPKPGLLEAMLKRKRII